ncbi:hypothetical protein SBF1_990010 [Candidatus Desulfosporosinus infrequens]|uniref:Uncharacterized protein n=1 Tax=Candidatus Desulfosporosinus infrequens TaxID=2043169 RepID=A0A2U3LYU5_9FIRM|nr:hypothetical protein SBF1_990010 [Candidatus Desulfosporosinus infrequens]
MVKAPCPRLSLSTQNLITGEIKLPIGENWVAFLEIIIMKEMTKLSDQWQF